MSEFQAMVLTDWTTCEDGDDEKNCYILIFAWVIDVTFTERVWTIFNHRVHHASHEC